MAFQSNVPIPHFDPVVKPDRFLTEAWERWFDQLQLITDAAAIRVASVNVTAQTASIGTTDISDGGLNAGLYRISYYVRVTAPASVSSSINVSFEWTDGGITQQHLGPLITGNTTTTWESESKLIHVDALSPLRYFTGYGSNPAGMMEYALYITVEEVNA